MKVQYLRGFLASGVLGGALLTCAALVSQAQVYTLTSPNAFINGTPAGMVDWNIKGVDVLGLQAMYIRVGTAGGESLLTGGTFAPSINGPHAGSVTYNSSGARIKNSLSLVGSAGSDESKLNQTISISNTSGSPLDLHFFLYSDFNLAGIAGGQSITIQPAASFYTYALQSDLVGNGVLQTLNSSINPTAGEVGTAAILLAKFQDGLPTNLSNQQTASGDVAWAFQWDLSLPANGGANLSILYTVPEPSTVALGLLGLALVVVNRKRR